MKQRTKWPLDRKLTRFVTLLCVLLVGVDLAWSYVDRVVAIREVAVETGNLAQSLAQHADNIIGSVDVVIRGLRERLEIDGWQPDKIDRLRKVMMDRITDLPALHALFAIDERGLSIVNSLQDRSRSLEYNDRSYFQFHRDHADRTPRISGPFRSKADGSWIIVVSLRIDHADGSFAGVVIGTIAADFFQKIYDSFSIGSNGEILLARSDGSVLVRRPYNEPAGGQVTVSAELAQMQKSIPATTSLVSPVDGIERFASTAPAVRYPLIVGVSREKSSALARWWADAIAHLAGILIIVTCIRALGWRLARQIRDHSEAVALHTLLAKHSRDAIVCTDLHGKRRYVSPAFEAITGWAPEVLKGQQWNEHVHPDDDRLVEQSLHELRSGVEQIQVRYRYLKPSGGHVWVELKASLLPGPDGLPSAYVGNIRDISETKRVEEDLEAANRQLIELTLTDSLTSIANRRRFDMVLDREWQRLTRSGSTLSLLMLDIDRFKALNDRRGHQEGDDCLRQVASALNDAVGRAQDLVARYGGEEFAIILPETSQASSLLLAERARRAVEALAIPNHASDIGVVTVSIGVATIVPSRSFDAEMLLRSADRALYEAKSGGRNRVAAAEPGKIRIAG